MNSLQMTSKERMLTALSGGIPDRVPVAPDISNMIPCRLTNRPFWDIYLYRTPPLTIAYIDAVKYFGIDGWLVDDSVQFELRSDVRIERHILSRSKEAIYQKNIWHTPDGDLSETICYSVSNPPTWTEKLIKDLSQDFKKIRHLFSGIKSYDASFLKIIKEKYGELGILSAMVVPPGFQTFVNYFNDHLEGCVYAYYDNADLFAELSDLFAKQELQKLEILLNCGYDSVLFSASGSVTLQSPQIWDELTLPFLKKGTALCKQAGILSGMHSCGFQRHLVKRCAEQTDLGYVNPLEIPPMGDCSLGEIKQLHGGKLALMGNLHTTDVMLSPNKDLVFLESLKAIRDAAPNGGFVLSTGDQCGRDTPDDNIFTMLQAAYKFGTYPLNLRIIEETIQNLDLKLKAHSL